MRNKNLSSGRRNFLKVFGVGLTGSVLSPFASQGAKLKMGKRKVRIGLLLPASTEHPGYPKSFLKGLNMGLNQHNAIKQGKIELITEQVNFGTPLITKEKSTKLINENDIDVMVGLLNSEVCTHISSTIKNSQTPFILANAGENHPVAEIRNNPFIFMNHLGLYQSNYRLGELMVKKAGKKALIVTSFYDSGYDALFTFRQGVEKAGGKVIETLVEQANDIDFKQKVHDQIKVQNPDFVFVFMNGKSAYDILNFHGLSGRKTLMVTSNFVLEENRLHELGNINSSIYSVTSWCNSLNLDSNKSFCSDFEKEHHDKPNSFTLLGYETGLQIYTALTKMSPDFNGKVFTDFLSSVEIDSPRGKLSFEKETGVIKVPLYAIECHKNSGTYEIEKRIIGEIESIESNHIDFTVLDSDLRSGWLNPYLFV